uniref:Protein kinase domain-containing protein n=1 Tax=Heterorhabditis bacteriophora TaxID=37862 RepID=A0A1I7WBA0_HETBA
MTSGLVAEVHGSHLRGSSITIWIIISISILEIAMLLKVPTHELGPHFLESHTLFQPLVLSIIKLTANSPDEQVPYLMDMLKYCCSEMTIAEFDSIHCQRHAAELQRREEVQNDMRNFRQFLLQLNGSLPTARNIKSFLVRITNQIFLLFIYSNGVHYIYRCLVNLLLKEINFCSFLLHNLVELQYYVFEILKDNIHLCSLSYTFTLSGCHTNFTIL